VSVFHLPFSVWASHTVYASITFQYIPYSSSCSVCFWS